MYDQNVTNLFVLAYTGMLKMLENSLTLFFWCSDCLTARSYRSICYRFFGSFEVACLLRRRRSVVGNVHIPLAGRTKGEKTMTVATRKTAAWSRSLVRAGRTVMSEPNWIGPAWPLRPAYNAEGKYVDGLEKIISNPKRERTWPGSNSLYYICARPFFITIKKSVCFHRLHVGRWKIITKQTDL